MNQSPTNLLLQLGRWIRIGKVKAIVSDCKVDSVADVMVIEKRSVNAEILHSPVPPEPTRVDRLPGELGVAKVVGQRLTHVITAADHVVALVRPAADLEGWGALWEIVEDVDVDFWCAKASFCWLEREG